LHQEDQILFEQLKNKIVATMQQSFPGISPSISEWKGQDIVNFQEELLQKVNANLSEKWFYTHMKAHNKSLPRIDVLNLLSKYTGYEDWKDFVHRNSSLMPLRNSSTGRKYFILVPLLATGIMGVFYLFFLLINTREYVFSFYDADTKEPVTNSNIEVILLKENESPVNYLCNKDGSFTMRTDQSFIQLVVNSPYYRTDTISRTLKKFNKHESLALHANEYALMLRYFSDMEVDDWQKRRAKLNEMFDDAAMICQVFGDKNPTGMEMYTKSEFIDKLTVPTHSLKHIEILDTKMIGERIMVLRFKTSENTK
jgi:hypothetical protein